MSNMMWDASTPPHTSPAGYKACAGYIGGNTPHVWTNAEWARFRSLRKLPIWVSGAAVPGAPYGADKDAADILARLRALKVPKGTAVAIDMETSVAPEYLGKLGPIVRGAGYYPWVYGSASTVFGNPALNGYWVADYAGRGPFMYKHRSVRATQYTSGPEHDSSVVKLWPYLFRLSSKW